MAVGAVLVLLILSVAAPASLAAQHMVGGSSGWSLGVDYTTWASGQTFAVGDTLLFTYGSSHTVDVVSQSDYSSCNANSPQNSYTDGNTSIPLTSAGTMYFICGTSGHCQGGMKLAVTVSASTVSSAPSGSPASTSPPPPPPDNSAAATANLGGKMCLLLVFSLWVVGYIGFMA